MKTLLILILLSMTTVHAQNYPTVDGQDFRVNDYWVWAYFEKERNTDNWNEPYLYEKYTVVKVEDEMITIEMSSDTVYPVHLAAHHKFRVNLKTCLTHYNSLENLKPWSLEFYTKTFSPQWELVSQYHKNLVFTEKFNCVAKSKKTMESTLQTLLGTVDVFKHELADWDSYYIKNQDRKAGVAALKYFDKYYKFELMDSSYF